MKEITFTIDGKVVRAREGETVLKAAWKAALFIPALCTHPDLLPARGTKVKKIVFRGSNAIQGTESDYRFEGCRLCIVEIEGREGNYTACDTPAAEGMVIFTNTPELQQLRQKYLAEILTNHPHTCLLCAQREGCNLIQCSSDVPEEERCCPKFNDCELRKFAEYIGIKGDIHRYMPGRLPVIDNEPLIVFDYNLCIGCLRCVRACQDLAGRGALGFARQAQDVIVGTVAPGLKESGCKFCGACIEVCPTGTLADKSEKAGTVRAGKLNISPPVIPPEGLNELSDQNVTSVPDNEGVYQLMDEGKQVIYIKGTMNLHRELREQLETNKIARYFKWEREPMFTRRESELIQQFLQIQGKLPAQNDELADLF